MSLSLISVSSNTYVAEWKDNKGKPRILGRVTTMFSPPKETAVEAYANSHPDERRQDVCWGEICTYVCFYLPTNSEESKTVAKQYASLRG